MTFDRKFNSDPEYLALLLDNSNEGIYACDTEFNTTFRNQRLVEIHAFPENLPANKWPEYIQIMEADGITPTKEENLPLLKAVRGEATKDSYHILKRKNHNDILVKYNARPLRDGSGKLIGAILTAEECKDLEESKARFQAIFEQSPLSIQIVDKSGKTILVNKAFQDLWSISDEFVTQYILKEYNMLQDKILEEAGELDNIRKAFAGETVLIKEFLYDPSTQGFPGRPRYARGILYPLKDSDNQVKEVVIIHQDVTDQVKSQKEREREESIKAYMNQVKSYLMSSIEFEKVIEKIALASIPFLADGCMFDIVEGSQIRRITTKHRDPVKQGFMNELQQKYNPKIDSPQPTSRCIRTGQAEFLKIIDPQIIKNNTYDDRHAYLITQIDIASHISVPLIIRGKIIGALNLFVGRDRTPFDDKDFTAIQELARHASLAMDNAQLYRDSKNAIQLRDDFISIASHELRTPITSLNLQLEVLTNIVEDLPQDIASAKLMHKFFGSTKMQLKRLTRLVDDMLDISRISTGKLSLNLKNVYMNQLIQDLIERFNEQLRLHEIETKFIFTDDITFVCDPERIEQVITNFMTNAIRYGGKQPIHIHLEQCDDFVTIKVKDHGRGISKDDQERIFKRFERAHTDEDVNGLGLGLYINRQIVEEHKGKITLESEPGKGAVFIVQLPKVTA
jgi:PAS domain S-box-containing protein